MSQFGELAVRRDDDGADCRETREPEKRIPVMRGPTKVTPLALHGQRRSDVWLRKWSPHREALLTQLGALRNGLVAFGPIWGAGAAVVGYSQLGK